MGPPARSSAQFGQLLQEVDFEGIRKPSVEETSTFLCWKSLTLISILKFRREEITILMMRVACVQAASFL